MYSCAHICIPTPKCIFRAFRCFTWDDCTAPNVSVPQENGSWISGLVPEDIQMLIYFQILSYRYKGSINLINLIIFSWKFNFMCSKKSTYHALNLYSFTFNSDFYKFSYIFRLFLMINPMNNIIITEQITLRKDYIVWPSEYCRILLQYFFFWRGRN